MSTIFVTGAGTDIGKTWVCCRLIAALPPALRLRVIKPVVTGFLMGSEPFNAAGPASEPSRSEPSRSEPMDSEPLGSDPSSAPSIPPASELKGSDPFISPFISAASDPERLLRAQGLAPTEAAIAATSPWRFRAPLSADMAAAREQRVVPFDELVDFSRAPAGIELNLVEGIGGVMAPLDQSRTVLDWIAALGAPALLVTGSYLGSLSHTLTAAAALANRGIETLAVVISASLEEPVPTAETARCLASFVDPVPVIALPRDENANAAELAALVLKRIGKS